MSTKSSVKPYIPASKSLPEMTIKAVLLGIILAVVMAGANAYLALKIGMSVSACIPAAVISMAILRLFKTSNILENNIVQTSASVGEAMAAALAFTLPVLVMIGYWNDFPFLVTASITMVGGFLGIMMTVPLRRAMIVESDLKFPEGVATAEVLKAGEATGSEGAKHLMVGGVISGVVKLFQSGFQVISDSISHWYYVGSTVMGIGGGMSLAIAGAGYIIGFRACLCVFSGAIIGWFIGVPLYGYLEGIPLDSGDAHSAAVMIWNTKIRIIGVGAMIVGGLWTIVELWPSLVTAVKSSIKAAQNTKLNGRDSVERTEKDIPFKFVAITTALLTIPLYIILNYLLETSHIALSGSMMFASTLILLGISLVLSFVCCAISAYMTGLMGSSNNPLSGVLILCILALSFVMVLLMGSGIDFNLNAEAAIDAAGIVIVLLAILACGGAVASDNFQDLKSGQLVGATPWKQQVILLVGTVASALVLAPILQLLFEAYGFGDVMPREGMDPTQALAVPKAALFSGLIQAIFTHTMDWTMILIGCAIAVAIIILDRICVARNNGWRFPVIATAVGIYFPLDITVPIILGGLVALFADKAMARAKTSANDQEALGRKGLLFAAGLIAGEAIVGILLAIPFVAYQSTEVLKINIPLLSSIPQMAGVAIVGAALYYFYKNASPQLAKG